MDKDTLKMLGLTTEELTNRVVGKCVEELLTGVSFDEEGDEWRSKSTLARKLDERIKQHIDAAVCTLAEKHVLPKVSEYIEGLTLQTTNQWGERRGQPVSFIEYMTQRADAYMREEVNFDGKSKAETGDNYGFKVSGTRVASLIHKHLHYSIETAMKQALANANSSIALGLEGAVKAALENATAALKVSVKTQ